MPASGQASCNIPSLQPVSGFGSQHKSICSQKMAPQGIRKLILNLNHVCNSLAPSLRRVACACLCPFTTTNQGGLWSAPISLPEGKPDIVLPYPLHTLVAPLKPLSDSARTKAPKKKPAARLGSGVRCACASRKPSGD